MPRYFVVRWRLLRRLAPFLKSVRLALTTSLCVRALQFAVALGPPLLLRSFVDDVIIGGSIGLVVWLLLGVLVAFAAETALKAAEVAARHRVAARLAVRMRHRNCEAALMTGRTVGSGDLKRAVEEDVTHIDGVLQDHILGTLLVGIRLLVLATKIGRASCRERV